MGDEHLARLARSTEVVGGQAVGVPAGVLGGQIPDQGGESLASIDAGSVVRFYKSLRKRGLSDRSARNHLACVSVVIRFANMEASDADVIRNPVPEARERLRNWIEPKKPRVSLHPDECAARVEAWLRR